MKYDLLDLVGVAVSTTIGAAWNMSSAAMCGIIAIITIVVLTRVTARSRN